MSGENPGLSLLPGTDSCGGIAAKYNERRFKEYSHGTVPVPNAHADGKLGGCKVICFEVGPEKKKTIQLKSFFQLLVLFFYGLQLHGSVQSDLI